MANTEKPTILVVEDEADLNKLIVEILESESIQIESAKDGLEALEMLEKKPNISAILSDIHMPRMSGLELLKKLRAQFRPIPFVILTAYGNPQSMREAIQLNATDFLDKPFSGEELVKVAKKAIEYGEEIKKIEKDIEILYQNSGHKDAEFLKRVKRTTLNMRAENTIYVENEKIKTRKT
jgi:CheY-like chemotaxis protein